MTELVDARPGGLDVLFRKGDAFTLSLTWPVGELVGRSFTALLDAAPLSVGIVGDVMTVTVSAAQSAAAAASGIFQLTETTGGGSLEVVVGLWSPSLKPAARTSAAVVVATGGATVNVSVVTASRRIVEPNLRAQNPVDWPERIFNTADAASTATALTFEHGQVVIRGAGTGTGVKSNRRTVFLIPGSPRGYSRIRSRWGGRAEGAALMPQRGHMHGVGIQADGKRRGVIVWHDTLFGLANLLNLGVWEGDPANPETQVVIPAVATLDKVNVSAGSRTSNVVTLTVPTGHGFVAGDVVAVDMTDNTYDGTFVLSSVTATTILYPQTAADDVSAGTGNVLISRQAPTKAELDRQIAVSASARTSGVVTATVPAGHPFQVGDSVSVDLAVASYDGQFYVTAVTSTTVVWRQSAADDAAGGSGTIRKVFPYWVESEWRPGLVRARAWPDVGVNLGAAGPLPAGPPPWESAWSISVDISVTGASQPDPQRGEGAALVAAHLASGSTITEIRYDNVIVDDL